MTMGCNDQVKRKLWLSFQDGIFPQIPESLSHHCEAWWHQQSTDQVWPDTQAHQSSTGVFSQSPHAIKQMKACQNE